MGFACNVVTGQGPIVPCSKHVRAGGGGGRGVV